MHKLINPSRAWEDFCKNNPSKKFMPQPLWKSLRLAVKILATFRPTWLLKRYAALARRQGFRRSFFILSFDCDTDRDLEVVATVHARVLETGIIPVYAVPGELLEKGRDIFQDLASTGVEFLNHGYRAHCHFEARINEYISSFFYNELKPETICEDINQAHLTHVKILNKAPFGFRAPHFGTFQDPDQLNFLHQTLKRMGYLYSSSTMPLYGFLYGPMRAIGENFFEFPLSGCHDNPLILLDSWNFRCAPGYRAGQKDFVLQFRKMVTFFLRPGSCGLFNIYADPSHVYDWPEFYECIKLAAPLAINSYNYLFRQIRTWRP